MSVYSLDEQTIESVRKFIFDYHKKNQVFPKFSEAEKTLNLDKNIIRMCCQELSKRNKGIQRNYSQYKVVAGKHEKEELKNVIEKAQAAIEKIKINFDAIFIGVLRVFLALVGIAAIIMVVFFIYSWGVAYFKIKFFAFLLGLTFTLFSVSAFQVSAVYRQNGERGNALIYLVLWIVVLLFSMHTTIAYLYNTKIAKQENAVINNNDTDKQGVQYSDIIKRESEKENDLVTLKVRLQDLNNILKQYDTGDKIETGRKTYDDTNRKVADQEKKISMAQSELEKIRNEKKMFLEKDLKAGVVQKNENKDFYSWIAGMFKIDKDILEFLVSCFPAIFMDIIAPFSIAGALFLKRKEKRKSILASLIEKLFSKKIQSENVRNL